MTFAGRLPGLDPAWSRNVVVPGPDGASARWSILDTGDDKAAVGTMLCVHGNPTWSYLWRRFLATAPPGWRVVAVDQLGMGWSERTGPRTMAQRIDDLGRLTDAVLPAGPVVVVAHDWGGPIALGWAQAHRERVSRIVLTNTAVSQPSDAAPPALIRLARSTPLRDLVCATTPTFVRTTTALSRPPLDRAIRDAFASPYARPGRRRAVADFVADIPFEADHPSRATLDAVADGCAELTDIPTLMLWGARDPVFTPRYLEDLLDRLPQADVQWCPDASHLVTEDEPGAAELVWDWVATEPTPPVEQPLTGRLWDGLDARADDPATAVVELAGDERRSISFADLHRRVGDLAAGLTLDGVRPGDRVAVLIPPGIDLMVAVYACWRAGASIVVADAGLGLRRMGAALRSAGPDHVLGIPRALLAVRALRVPGRRIEDLAAVEHLGREDRERQPAGGGSEGSSPHTDTGREERQRRPAGGGSGGSSPHIDTELAVLFTSGATGPPKGVVYRHSQLLAQLSAVRGVMGLGESDRLVAAFAPFALYGPALGVPAAVPDMDVTKPATLTAAKLAEAVAAIGATVVFASPAALRNVVATANELDDSGTAALDGVRRVLSAGAPVPAALLRRVQEVVPGAELHTPYGMTECLPVTDIDRAAIAAAGVGDGVCVGRPIDGVRVRVAPLDSDGRAGTELVDTAGVTGEVCVAAAHVKDRYDRRWAAERASRRNPGWHRTGDVGHLDADGRLWIEGRLVHVITTAEWPLTPVGIEQRVESLPEVRLAAAVGVGPAGAQHLVVVVESDRDGLADPALAAAVRTVVDLPVAAVLTVAKLPVDIRHASKIDRVAVARRAERLTS